MTLETSVRKEKDLFWNMPLLICSCKFGHQTETTLSTGTPHVLPSSHQGCQPPTSSNIENWWGRDDRWHHNTRHMTSLWKNVQKRCYWNFNIWPNWFTSYLQSLLRIWQRHTRFCEKMFDVNSKVDQIRQRIWNFIVKKSNLQEMANFGDYPGDIRL